MCNCVTDKQIVVPGLGVKCVNALDTEKKYKSDSRFKNKITYTLNQKFKSAFNTIRSRYTAITHRAHNKEFQHFLTNANRLVLPSLVNLSTENT